jgi:hypothetical protein
MPHACLTRCGRKLPSRPWTSVVLKPVATMDAEIAVLKSVNSRFFEPRCSHSADEERPAACSAPECGCADDITSDLYGARPGLSLCIRARRRSPGRDAREGRQERVPHGSRDRRRSRVHLARSAAHLCLLADHEGRLAAIGGGAPRPSRAAHGHAVCPSLTGVPLRGSRSVGCIADADSAAHRSCAWEKGKKRATCPEAGSAAGESRRIFEGKWLLRLDSNQQPSG